MFARLAPALCGALTALTIVACAPVMPPASLHPMYEFSAAYPLGPLRAGDPLHVVWTPKLMRSSADEPTAVRLCVAVFGAYASVESLKLSSGGGRAECPPAGARIASQTLWTRSDAGQAFDLDLELPAEEGFYDVRQVIIYGDGPASSATSAGGIIEVRRP